jgi:hypothetical protein
MTNEQVLTMLENAIDHLLYSDEYWHNEDYLAIERAMTTLREAHKAVGPLGQVPSWERANLGASSTPAHQGTVLE